jgi:hypothetical protein
MPRKAPTKVIEHRITLGNYERTKIDEGFAIARRRTVTTTTTNLLNSISWPMLGIAALFYAGATIDDVLGGAKNLFDRTTNWVSDRVANSRLWNYTSDEIGREIEKVTNEKAQTYADWQAYMQGGGGFDDATSRGYKTKLQALENRDQILRQMLDDIVTGKNTEIGWLSNVRSVKEQQEFLQEQYEIYGGEGDLDWEINREDNRIYDEEGNWIGPDDGANQG